MCLFVYLSVCLFVRPYNICLPVCLYVCSSVCLCMSVRVSVYMYVDVCVCVYVVVQCLYINALSVRLFWIIYLYCTADFTLPLNSTAVSVFIVTS